MKTALSRRIATSVVVFLMAAGMFSMPVVQAHAAEGHSDSGGGATCAGGAVAPGTYASLTITGVCIIPKGKVVVRHNLVVGRNAALDTLTPATVIVWGDFVVEPGAEAILGCSPGIGCDFTTHDVIHGNVRIYQPLAAIFHSDTIYGHVSFQGGGGGVTCANQLPGGPPMTPVYSDFEGNVIAGEVNVSGLGSCWFGFIRNHVRSSVILNDNIMADPDANEVVSNVIRGNLVCSGNAPAPQVGDSFGGPNTVRGHEEGQCVGL